ncbi:HlyD family efflux transporter periplasmic adaptor subunit [Novosphingobium piscinae]|uniref:HlyD family efflux transporter periplasmic adaptor subunit n=1 Tax=Novosphingobium piscinae TaxID=1507448 RepID=A0A7X1G1R8_9SPHN|nr:HlyD family efflux transporter periplasmic adaptor subunit [Novosphingobium piscinae]MBC2670372.1 HlyD family efflux transporter periplasmic adaptor subunit [Novosphingobium piscinae]
MADATFAQDAAVDPVQARRQSQRRTWLTRLALLLAVAGLLWAAWYLLIGRNEVSTDNAYVNAEIAQVTPLISAQVVEVRVRDTQMVRRGDVLAVLDTSNARIAVAQAEADLAAARRRFEQAAATSESLSAQVAAGDAEVTRAEAQLTAAEADLTKAQTDLKRRESLRGTGAVSGEELTAVRRAFAAAKAAASSARAAVEQARASRTAAAGQLAASEALVAGSSIDTDPAVLAAKARLEAAQLDIVRAVIRAPIDGVITRRQVQIGQRVSQGAPIMSIVPVNNLYVDANFKERQLRRVKVGMPAKVVADLYGSDVVYHGRVAGISGGTGASMALIPAQNATGNWIKVVQRLPVRIELDPKELAAHPLRVGLSTEVEIDLTSAD